MGQHVRPNAFAVSPGYSYQLLGGPNSHDGRHHGLPFWIRLTRNQVVKQARKKPQSQLFLDYWLHHFAPLRCLLGLRDDGDEQIRRQYPGA